jgi:hypothetical protein
MPPALTCCSSWPRPPYQLAQQLLLLASSPPTTTLPALRGSAGAVICSLIMQQTAILLKWAIMPRHCSFCHAQLLHSQPCISICTNVFQMLRRASAPDLQARHSLSPRLLTQSRSPGIYFCFCPLCSSRSTAPSSPTDSTSHQFESSLLSSCLLISPCWSVATCHT